jgi:hypothetical protein
MTTEEILAIVFGCLFAIDQALAAIPSVKSNSVFQLISAILKILGGKNNPPN